MKPKCQKNILKQRKGLKKPEPHQGIAILSKLKDPSQDAKIVRRQRPGSKLAEGYLQRKSI